MEILDNSSPQDFVSIGRRKLNQKDYQGVIADFDQALASNPNDLDALSGRGNAYYNRGNTYNDLKEYEKAIADYNNEATSHQT